MKKILLSKSGGDLSRVIINKLQSHDHQPIILGKNVKPDNLERIYTGIDCVVSISESNANNHDQFNMGINNISPYQLLKQAIKSGVSEFVYIPLGKHASTPGLSKKINQDLQSLGLKFSIVYPNNAVWKNESKNK